MSEEARKESRYSARVERRFVIRRSHGKCEVCKFACRFIAVLHHIQPVRRGGLGNPSNLIALCPNCHAITHKIMQLRFGHSEEQNEFNSWLIASYPPPLVELLKGLGHRHVELVSGEWKAIYTEDIQWPVRPLPVRY